MTVTTMNPPALSEPAGYVHVAVAEGTRMVFLAGQVARDAQGAVVGEGDLAAQTAQALRNVAAGLAAAGATIADVAKLTIYVVDWSEEKMEQLMAGVVQAAGELGAAPLVPSTLVPVPRLVSPEFLVELDATAVV